MSKETFNPPKEELNIDIPEHSNRFMESRFRSDYKFAIKDFGAKAIKDEIPHKDVIGKNPSVCRSLYGIGYAFKKQGIDMGLNEYSNHVWLPCSTEQTRKEICFNCGSMFISGKFYSYLDLEKEEIKEEKAKK